MEDAIDLLIVVEGPRDIDIIRTLLEICGFPIEKISFNFVGGRITARSVLPLPTSNILFVFDADSPFIEPEVRRLSGEFNIEHWRIFPIPWSIEAWLFADVENTIRHARDSEQIPYEAINSLPEFIERPLDLAKTVFGSNRSIYQRIIYSMNISIAIRRSSSMRRFLEGVAKAMEIRLPSILSQAKLPLEIVKSLLIESSNPEKVLFRSLDGTTFRAGDIINELNNDTPMAREYVSELFRVARDMLAREARLASRNGELG